MTENRLAGADFVRAAACLVVLFHHLAQRLGPGEMPPALHFFRIFTNNGTFGVGLFFVLSGFLLARPFWRALDKGMPMPSLRIYAVRRAARILPGFWLALTVSFVCSVAIFGARLDGELVLRYIAGLLLLADWHWLTFFPVEVNGPLWSIGFETTSYVLLPLGFALLFWQGGGSWWQSRVLWAGVIALVLLGHWLIVEFYPIDPVGRGWQFGLVGGAKLWVPRYNPLGFFAMFTIGSLAAGLHVTWAKYRSPVFDVLALAGLGLCVAVFVANVDARDASVYGWLDIPYDFPWLVLAVALVLAATPSSLFVGLVLDNRLSRYVARVSFGVYVWHYLVIELVRTMWFPDFRMFSVDDPVMFVAASLAIMIVTFAIAHISFHLIEKPIMLWQRARETLSRDGAAAAREARSLHA